jgi:hypothetical protein
MYKEFIDKLKERKEEREKTYNRLKGMIEGARLTNLNQTEKSFMSILEYAMDSFKTHQDSIDTLREAIIYSFQRLETLEKKVRKMKDSIDTFNENQ